MGEEDLISPIENNSRSKSEIFLIIGIIALLVIILVGTIFVYFKAKGGDKESFSPAGPPATRDFSQLPASNNSDNLTQENQVAAEQVVTLPSTVNDDGGAASLEASNPDETSGGAASPQSSSPDPNEDNGAATESQTNFDQQASADTLTETSPDPVSSGGAADLPAYDPANSGGAAN
ncbi:MAG: hypothetical protein Q8Q31_00900 [Nanoarchaeota archaeon]|nr:hypothetical protein [Nanoarchaeota archaeon]